MRLKEIIGEYPVLGEYEDCDIKELSVFSGKKTENGLFFAIEGANYNGEAFVGDAVRNGATAVVATKKIEGVNTVVTKEPRRAYAYFSAKFYSEPQKKLKIIGAVGTNGKTTTCFLIADILRSAGKRAAVIGTSGVSYPEYSGETTHTTPDPQALYHYLDELQKRGAEYVVMEVSAHAISQFKVDPIRFEALVFTNCTVDHLDYFKDFKTYADVKAGFMTRERAKKLVVNADDATGRMIAAREKCVTYGIKCPSDVFAVNVKESEKGVSYVANIFDGLYEVKSGLLGTFNVYNELAAASVAAAIGISVDDVGRGLCAASPVRGRMQRVPFPRGTVYVDYAHTPDGLEKSLLFLRKITKGSLYCLFGCGGNRDKEKRPRMGRVAGDIADFVILTSDNPRYEDPSVIARETEVGLREATRDYICIEKRGAAIGYALGLLKDGDVLLVAGKGSEEYQEIMGIKHYFSDERLIREIGEGYAD